MDEQVEKSMNSKEKCLLELYRELHFGQNPVCQKCRKEGTALSRPIGAWLIGNEFYTHNTRVLFVGKNARGEMDEPDRGFQTAFKVSRELWNKPWPYWSYTRAITQRLYGNDSIENIAFTNIVKCNDSEREDTTSDHTKNCCICELKVIGKEIAIIEPTHIIFYTSWWYDEYIHSIFDEFNIMKDTKISIGNGEMPWLEANGSLEGKNIKVLRIGHPQGKNKSEYVSAVAEWIEKET